MFRLIPVLLTAITIAACTPAPLMTTVPRDIGPGELHNYWVPAQRTTDIAVPAEAQKENVPGRVVVAYIIDSDGVVIEPTVVESEPEGVYDEAALNLIRTQRFVPAAANANRTPVRTRTEISFNAGGTDLQ